MLLSGGGIVVKIRHKKAKKGKKRQKKGVFTTQRKHNHGHLFERHVIRINLVNPFHSVSVLLQLFTRQSCSGAGAVGHGGWFMRTVCHQIVRIKEITDIPNKVS